MDIRGLVYQAFLHSNKFLLHGFLACIYFLILTVTAWQGVTSILENRVRTETGHNWIAYLPGIPIFVFDFEIRRMYKRKEKWWSFLIKTVAWINYYATIIGSEFAFSYQLIHLTNLYLMFYPVFGFVYSFLL